MGGEAPAALSRGPARPGGAAPAPPPLDPPLPLSTQRICPERTSKASQAAVVSLSRPEKPPIPATSLPAVTSAAASDWLATASVPPPWAVV